MSVLLMPDGRSVCAKTGKRAFGSSDAAKRARKRYKKGARSEHEHSFRSYLCPYCDYYHNTSTPFRLN
jgi:hypothetical protein